MNDYMIAQINVETGETVVRPMTPEEIAELPKPETNDLPAV